MKGGEGTSRGVTVLGSTGSIGESTLRVAARHLDRFHLVGLAANRSLKRLQEQVAEFRPQTAVLADSSLRASFPAPSPNGVRWEWGREALLELAADPAAEVVVNALVGAAGLEPTLQVLKAGKRLALANKESLVVAGDLVMEAARQGGGMLLPVDSEHSAILQCLEGSSRAGVSRLVLTASGGPFRGWDAQRLAAVGPRDALRHPTWNMGAKISVDSATLANKALEVIEAHHLYGISYPRIEVVVHPQSIIHSLVEFVDGSVMAQMGFPTMELPILYALSYPERVEDGELRTFDALRSSPLTFEAVDEKAFPLFGLGISAGRQGGVAPAVFNAANEVAVQAFLEERIGFSGMARVVGETLESTPSGAAGNLEEILDVDRVARERARETVRRMES
ncbi:MAG: 1-deoxy-D-xylulose-5-phosphate reductoisomerase [Gemmatimonadota bacterium]